MKTIAIIGAGFSGTMVAVHLMRQPSAEPTTIALIERCGRFSAGVAYGTRYDSHLLNVPAGRMSAFEDDHEHFLRWACERAPAITGGTFVSRKLFGEYLAWLLDSTEDRASASVRLLRVPAQAVAIRTGAPSAQVTVELNAGGQVRADCAVLTTGNFPPADPPVAAPTFYQCSSRYARDPWAADALDVDSHADVLLLGTGLTMLDMALALRDRQHAGRIIAISRRGLLPQPHRVSDRPPPTHPRPEGIDRWPGTARAVLRAVRTEVRKGAEHGVDWREVVTALRHDTPALWMKLPATERARFLQHVRPFWETHRHRAAPEVAAAIAAMMQTGQLRVLAARVAAFEENNEAVHATFRRRGASALESLRVGKVVNCTGPDTNLARVREPLIASMREAGLVRPDALGLGLDSDADGALLNAHGVAQSNLFLVGPLRKGQLWENTAVPELRIEAQRMAARLGRVPTAHASPKAQAENQPPQDIVAA